MDVVCGGAGLPGPPIGKIGGLPPALGRAGQSIHFLVKEVAGYDEDVVFLIVSDESAFSRRVPLVIGTCTLGHIINIMKESELDQMSTPWATVHLAEMLS